MKLTKEQFDKKYEINELSNIEIFDTIFYLFNRDAELQALENRSCENCKYDYVDIDENCERCNRYYEDKFEIKE